MATALAAVVASSVARADPPRECAALPRPDPAALEPYLKAGPYAAGLRMAEAGRAANAARALGIAWASVRRDLAAAFVAATPECLPGRMQSPLHRRVFTVPAQAVPAEDRFAPPAPILWTVAIARCQAGDPAAAAAWLAPTALAGDPEAAAATAVLWTASGQAARALALLPGGANCRASCVAARALALATAGRAADARAVALPDAATAPAHVRATLLLLARALEAPR